MATHRADEAAAKTRRESIEAAIERATTALEQFRQSGAAPTVDQTIDACCSLLLAERLVTSIGSWTEDHLVVELSQHHRDKLDRLRNDREAPFRAQILGRVDGLRGLCDAWRRSFGNVQQPMVADDATEAQRAAAYVIATYLNSDLTDCCELRQECRELALEAVFLEADWPIEVGAFCALAGQFRAIANDLQDDRGVTFCRHDEKFAHEGTRPPPSLQSARASAPGSPWFGVKGFWQFLNEGITEKRRAAAWRDLASFGLKRVQWFAENEPDSHFAHLFNVFGEELWMAIESEEFWYVVGRGFFRPGDWAGRAASLRPVTSHAGVLIRLGLDRELKELNENFILGNWIAVMAIARVVMERVLKERLGLPPETQKPDLETLVNRFCDQIPNTGGGDIRGDLHRLRNAANERLHRREAEWLHLRDEVLRFDEAKLEARARESIVSLHRLFSVIERVSAQ